MVWGKSVAASLLIAVAPADVRAEIEKLYSMDPVERTRAIINLGEMGPRAAPAKPFLMEMMYDSHPVVLNPPSPPEAVEPLLGLLMDKEAKVRENAVKALGKIGDPRAARNPLFPPFEKGDEGGLEDRAIEM